MKLPTKAQWDEMAEAFGTPFEKQTKWQKRITHSGLCLACDLTINGDNSVPLSEEYKIPEYIVFGSYEARGWWDWDKRNRSFFCMLMAAITEAGDMESLVEEV